ncbi:unnamed protein product, partial [Discosporangium mesarthrocarpum]
TATSAPPLRLPVSRNASIPRDEVKLTERLGEGFYGVVYKGIWEGRPIAGKRLKCSQDNPNAMRAFHYEV